jgi:hypothetical protein
MSQGVLQLTIIKRLYIQRKIRHREKGTRLNKKCLENFSSTSNFDLNSPYKRAMLKLLKILPSYFSVGKLKFVRKILKSSVNTSQRIHCISILNTKWLMLFREIITAYSKNTCINPHEWASEKMQNAISFILNQISIQPSLY